MYIVLSGARTGSSMLCSALAASKQAGNPREFLHPDYANPYHQRKGRWSIAEFMAELVAEHTSPNGYFGMKVHDLQYRHFFGSDREAGLAFLGQFQRFIRVYRRNKIDQATSNMLANERQVWNITDPAKRPVERDFRPDDVDKIAAGVANFAKHDRFWQEVIGPFRKQTIDIAYEDLATDPEAEFARAMLHLGIEIDLDNIPKPTTVRVAGERTRRIRDEFLRSINGESFGGRQ